MLMERFRTDVRRNKTEPKNYIALNRKKACAKSPSHLPPAPAVRPGIEARRVLHRSEREPPLTGDVRRSIDQLASIISSGDLERIIQLAKEIKGTTSSGWLAPPLGTTKGEEQPNHLHSQTHSEDNIKTQTHQYQPVRAVEPSYVPGLDVDSGDAHKRLTAAPQSISTEPYYGRGQGLRQLLELDSAPPVLPYVAKQPHNTRGSELAKRAQLQETEYYPWGKPGAGAPLSTFKGYDVQPQANLAINHKPTQVNIQHDYSNNSAHNSDIMIRNSDSLRPEEERKRRASQYMLDLQAQVNEKERLKREEQERQAEFDRLLNDRIARDQNRLFIEAEKEKERLNMKKQDASKRFEFLQSKIEEQKQLAIAERERRNKRHHTNKSRVKQNNSPISLQTINSTVINSPYNKQKSLKPKKQTEQQTNIKQVEIRNPPPSQIHIIKSNNTNTKSSSMPTTRQVDCEHYETGKNYLNVSSEYVLDVSRPSSVVIDHVNSIHDTNAQLTTQLNTAALLQQQVYDGEESFSVIRQLQKLKQGLQVKQQELHSNYY